MLEKGTCSCVAVKFALVVLTATFSVSSLAAYIAERMTEWGLRIVETVGVRRGWSCHVGPTSH